MAFQVCSVMLIVETSLYNNKKYKILRQSLTRDITNSLATGNKNKSVTLKKKSAIHEMYKKFNNTCIYNLSHL